MANNIPCECVQIRDTKIGDFFKLTPTDTAPVWVRDEYNRSTKKYSAFRYDDICAFSEFSPTRYVYVNFTF